jgi:NitT/TauT family transport system ATP-binding protein
MAADIQLAHLSHRFAGAGVPTIDDLSLSIPAGRTTVLVGASGCGKTTVLRLIAGLLKPDSGDIRFDPRQPPGLAYVFQTPALMPWATVAENTALPLVLGGAPDARKVADALAAVGLSGKAAARPHELSGGQQMRVSLARALVSGASRLMLDEPFAALDEITRQKLIELIEELRVERRLTVVLVTHNISEAVFIGDQVALMVPTPGRLARLIKIDGPDIRNAAFRRDPSYHGQCAAVSALLADLMEGARA